MQQQDDDVRQNGHQETLAASRADHDTVRARGVMPSLEDHRLITEARANAIFERLDGMKTGGGDLELHFSAWWCGSLRWARNRVSMAGDQRDVALTIVRRTKYGWSGAKINQTDDESLRAALVAVERRANMRSPFPLFAQLDGVNRGFYGERFTNVPQPYPETAIFSDATFHVTPEQRAHLAQTLTEGAETQQLLSAGYIEMRVMERQRYGDKIQPVDVKDWMPSNEPPQGHGASRMARDEAYVLFTTSQCSMTVRHPKGVGSGWAGLSSYDWAAIDAPALARVALDKCLTSLNPVAIEPGRYTVILEPQAVATIVGMLILAIESGRLRHESKNSPGLFGLDLDPALGLRRTRLGQQIIDDRISITHDPMDPRLGVVPELGLRPVTWIDHGRLAALAHEREYALANLREDVSNIPRRSYHMSGGNTTIEDMIATTKRGLIVTRFSGVRPFYDRSLLMSGLTRDGFWLVENGKISKAVKNMRFTDSPLFVLNQIEQLGVPVPTFEGGRQLSPALVPPVKSRDFAFTATVDAI